MGDPFDDFSVNGEPFVLPKALLSSVYALRPMC